MTYTFHTSITFLFIHMQYINNDAARNLHETKKITVSRCVLLERYIMQSTALNKEIFVRQLLV